MYADNVALPAAALSTGRATIHQYLLPTAANPSYDAQTSYSPCYACHVGSDAASADSNGGNAPILTCHRRNAERCADRNVDILTLRSSNTAAMYDQGPDLQNILRYIVRSTYDSDLKSDKISLGIS